MLTRVEYYLGGNHTADRKIAFTSNSTSRMAESQEVFKDLLLRGKLVACQMKLITTCNFLQAFNIYQNNFLS